MQKRPYVSFESGLAKLQKYCAYQDRCHQEVRTKLLDIGMRGEELELIIIELIQEKYLDEERFARSFARGKFRIKQWGRTKIKQELKRKGISTYILKKAMEEIDEEDYLDTMTKVLEKKALTLRENNAFKRFQKLYVHGMRRGFEAHLVKEILTSWLKKN